MSSIPPPSFSLFITRVWGRTLLETGKVSQHRSSTHYQNALLCIPVRLGYDMLLYLLLFLPKYKQIFFMLLFFLVKQNLYFFILQHKRWEVEAQGIHPLVMFRTQPGSSLNVQSSKTQLWGWWFNLGRSLNSNQITHWTHPSPQSCVLTLEI